MNKNLRVLIADDSPTALALLKYIVNSAPDMRVVGEAWDGQQAVKLAHDLRPDVILMDIIMPHMDGLKATQEIMHSTPTPIVLVSAGLENIETDIAFQAISLGALAVHRKPAGIYHPAHETETTQLLNKLRLMAGVRVIRHWKKQPDFTPDTPIETIVDLPQLSAPPAVVAIVASTGGPAALHTIIQQLPSEFPLPVIIVQHISPDFVTSLINWMGQNSPLPIELAHPGKHPVPGVVYFAPERVHLRLTSGRRFEVDPDPGLYRHVPSGDVLLESVARQYGANAVGIVLTGIGDDGAQGLYAMHTAGAFTIAQDEATSVVYGMPKAAHTLGAARQVLPLQDIAPALIRLSQIKEVN